MVQKFLHHQHYRVETTLQILTPWPSRDLSFFTTSCLSKICQEELPVRLANRIAHLDMLPDLEDPGVETLDWVIGQNAQTFGVKIIGLARDVKVMVKVKVI